MNEPIPANPPISPYNPEMVAAFVPQGSNVWNQYFLGPRNRDPVAYPSSSTPTVTVQVNYPFVNASSSGVPIPAGVVLAGSYSHGDSENYLVVMGPNGDEWDFYDVSKPGDTPYPGSTFGASGAAVANGNWQAAEVSHYSPGWTGLGNQTCCGTDSGLLEADGIITLRDLRDTPTGGNWGHALNWSSWHVCTVSNVEGKPGFVYPATQDGDGRYSDAGCWPEGSRWQLDPSINCDTWPSMVDKPEYLKQMCRTLQVYGMIEAHGSTGQGDGDGIRAEYSGNFPAGTRYPWQDSTGAWPDPYSPSLNLPPDLLSHFRVIDWTRWTG